MKFSMKFLLVLVLFSTSLTGCWDMGSGEKIGTIIKLNRQGIFCKTWEAEIIRGGINNGSGVMGQSFHFTIEDESMAKQVEDYMNSQQEVKISYNIEAISWCRSDSNSHFLSKIETVHVIAPVPAQASEAVSNITPTTDTKAETNKEILEILTKQQELLELNQKLINKIVK